MEIKELCYYGNNAHMPLMVGRPFTEEEIYYNIVQKMIHILGASLNRLQMSKTLTT